MSEWMADVKAELARLGQTLAPDATLTTFDRPTGGAPVVVLDRVRDDVTPDYCVHGYASCIGCGAMCWLGSETVRLVQTREAYPVCLPCANDVIPRAMENGGRYMHRVEDHRRENGPHDE